MPRCALLLTIVPVCAMFLGCGGVAPPDLDPVLPDSGVSEIAAASDSTKDDAPDATTAQSLQAGPVDGDVPAPGGINSAEPAPDPVAEIGIPVSVNVIGGSSVEADVLVRFLIDDIEVHRTEWRVPAGESSITIGPELATRIEVSGTYEGGTPTPTLALAAGQGFAAGDVVEYVVPEPTAAGPGTVSGLIRDAATGSPLAGASVTLYLGETVVAMGSTGPGGTFVLEAPAGTGYQLVVSSDGHLDEVYRDIEVIEGEVSNLPPIPQVQDIVSDPGGAAGQILNALTGSPVEGLTIRLRRGINNTTGPVVAGTTTNAAGYSFSGLEPGVYTGEASGSGFITSYFTVVVIAGTVTGDQNANITPVLLEGQTRIVLSWGESPRDLDSHLTGPAVGGGRFRVYFVDQTYSEGTTTYAELDLDDVSSFGPETTTIYEQIDGVYRFLVHDFSNGGSTTSTALSASGATVNVFQGSSLVATFSVPADQGGTLWTVFELQGNVITPINTLSFERPSINSRVAGFEDPEAALFRDLPGK